METGRMVVVNRVAEFVDDHIVAQVLRKSHQKEAQRDVVAPRATPPLRARGADRKFFALQARRLRQPPDAARQVGFRRTAQLLDAGFPLLGRQLRRQGCPLAGEPFARRPDPFRFLLRKSKPVFAAPRRGTKAARRPWRAPKSKCGGRARSARGSPRPAGDAHRGGHRISTALIAIPCITTAESVRSNLIFSNRIRQRSSR